SGPRRSSPFPPRSDMSDTSLRIRVIAFSRSALVAGPSLTLRAFYPQPVSQRQKVLDLAEELDALPHERARPVEEAAGLDQDVRQGNDPHVGIRRLSADGVGNVPAEHHVGQPGR